MSAERTHRTSQLLQNARDILRAGDVAGAVDLCEQALRLQPGRMSARLLHARALLHAGRADEALVTLHAGQMYRATDAKPAPRRDRMRWLYLHAETLRRLDRASEAQADLRQLLDIEPMHRAAALKLASLVIETNPPEAIAPLKRILQAYPQDRLTKRLLARTLERCGQAEPAVRVRTDLKDESLHTARLCRRAGRRGEALDRYADLIARNPEDADLRVEAAQLAIDIGDDASAVRRLAEALNLREGHTTAAALLAQQHMRAGRFEPAAKTWWTLHRRDETNTEAIAGLTVCAVVLDRPAMARRLRDRLAARLDRPERRHLIGRMWRTALPGKLARDLTLGRRRDNVHSLLSVMLSEAAGTLRKASTQRPAHADLHYHHAVCMEELGEISTAQSDLDRALQINPRYTSAAARRAKLAA